MDLPMTISTIQILPYPLRDVFSIGVKYTYVLEILANNIDNPASAPLI